MNKKYDHTATKENLERAFSMESEARNKYAFFASVAKKEGYEQIAALLLHIACNEKEHAEIWYKELYGIGNTEENLTLSAETENMEWAHLYVQFADMAEREGFKDLAAKFRNVALIEMSHENMLRRLMTNVSNDHVFERGTEHEWVCRNCGYTCIEKEAPKTCPTCDHAQAYFEIKAENY